MSKTVRRLLAGGLLVALGAVAGAAFTGPGGGRLDAGKVGAASGSRRW